MALLGVSVFYLLTLLPVTRNGGIALFLEYEYFALYYAIPLITLIEVNPNLVFYAFTRCAVLEYTSHFNFLRKSCGNLMNNLSIDSVSRMGVYSFKSGGQRGAA